MRVEKENGMSLLRPSRGFLFAGVFTLMPGALYTAMISICLIRSLLDSPISLAMVAAHAAIWLLLFSPCALVGLHIFAAFPLFILRRGACDTGASTCEKHDILFFRTRRTHAVQRVAAASILSVRVERDASRVWRVSLDLVDGTEMLVDVTHMHYVALRMQAHLREMTSSCYQSSVSLDSRAPDAT